MRTLPQTHKHIATAILAVIAACGSMAAMSETVTLTGSNEVPPVTTSATGTANITVGADRSVKASVTTTGMTATASHIHMGAAGSNGRSEFPRRRHQWIIPRDDETANTHGFLECEIERVVRHVQVGIQLALIFHRRRGQ